MKAILLVRVSTKAQDFDEQEREIYNMAIKDGYLPECIIPVCEKESGIKLAEEERAGLNKIKELIEEDNEKQRVSDRNYLFDHADEEFVKKMEKIRLGKKLNKDK